MLKSICQNSGGEYEYVYIIVKNPCGRYFKKSERSPGIDKQQ